MKIKATLSLQINPFENIQPEIEITVPDGLKDDELVLYLWKRFNNIVSKASKTEEDKVNEMIETL